MEEVPRAMTALKGLVRVARGALGLDRVALAGEDSGRLVAASVALTPMAPALMGLARADSVLAVRVDLGLVPRDSVLAVLGRGDLGGAVAEVLASGRWDSADLVTRSHRP